MPPDRKLSPPPRPELSLRQVAVANYSLKHIEDARKWLLMEWSGNKLKFSTILALFSQCDTQ